MGIIASASIVAARNGGIQTPIPQNTYYNITKVTFDAVRLLLSFTFVDGTILDFDIARQPAQSPPNVPPNLKFPWSLAIETVQEAGMSDNAPNGFTPPVWRLYQY